LPAFGIAAVMYGG